MDEAAVFVAAQTGNDDDDAVVVFVSHLTSFPCVSLLFGLFFSVFIISRNEMYIIVLSTRYRNAMISGGLLIQEQHMCQIDGKTLDKIHTGAKSVENTKYT